MANTKISSLTVDSTPARATDYVPTYDASTVSTKKVLLNLLGQIQLLAGFSSGTPADATTYYFGAYNAFGLQTTDGARRIYIPRTGIITGAYVTILNGGTSGTTETSTISLRKNSTTDTTIGSNITTNGSGLVFASGYTFSAAVTVSDYVEVKWVTPTWVTNPTSVFMNIQLTLE